MRPITTVTVAVLQAGLDQPEAGKDLLDLLRQGICGNVPVLGGAVVSHKIADRPADQIGLISSCLQQLPSAVFT